MSWALIVSSGERESVFFRCFEGETGDFLVAGLHGGQAAAVAACLRSSGNRPSQARLTARGSHMEGHSLISTSRLR